MIRLAPRPGPRRCGYCLSSVATAVTCDACGAALHRLCAAELGRCPTLGCDEPPVIPFDRAPASGEHGRRLLERLGAMTIVAFTFLVPVVLAFAIGLRSSGR